MGGYNQTFTPTTQAVNIGTLPEWARPYLNYSHACYGAGTNEPYIVYVRQDGTVYLVFKTINIAYYDVCVNLEYDSASNQILNLS